MTLFVGGVVDGANIAVDESKHCIVVPHPVVPLTGPPADDTDIVASVRMKTDRYYRRRYYDRESGSISVRYVYGETYG